MTSNKIVPMRVYSTPPELSQIPKMEKRKLRSTSAQIRVLVDHMAMKPSMAISDGSSKGPTARTDLEWIKLKHLLREYGPDKSIEQWKHTWRDLKKRAKLEYAAVMADRPENATEVAISTQSKAVLEAIRFWKTDGDEEATSSTSAKPYEENEDRKENGQHNEDGDPLEYHVEVLDDYNDQEESNQSMENSHERTRLTATIPVLQKPTKRTYRRYSDPPYSRSPTPPRKRMNDTEENDTLSILDKFLEYEREKERMAHEREMSRIAQNDKVVKMLGRMVTVLESLSPGLKKYLEENSRDSS